VTLSILHAPINIAGAPGQLSAGLREAGARSDLLVWREHPFAYGATIALMVLPAPAALAYNLLHERARRASSLVSLAGLVGAVGLLVAIRLAPAVPLPT